jgi:hypothetical protein
MSGIKAKMQESGQKKAAGFEAAAFIKSDWLL